MPTLGNAASGWLTSQGVIKRGLVIPQGSLEVWRAARNNAASAATEVVIFGDSTTYGAAGAPGPSPYPWLRQLIDRAATAGYPIGASGLYNAADYAASYSFEADGYPNVTTMTGYTGGVPQAFIVGFIGNTGTVGGDTATIQGKGTAIRLWLAKKQNAGKASYSVDGGSVTTVDLLPPRTGSMPYESLPILISGLTDGVHSITVSSAGKSSIRQPSVSSSALQSLGSLTPGQPYYYKITALSANGESIPSSVIGPFTPDSSNKKVQVQVNGDYGYTGCKLYRSLTLGGTYQLITTNNTGVSRGSLMTLVDDGTGTPGANAPSSDTLGTFATGTDVEFTVDFLRSTGLIFHRSAVSGQSMNGILDAINDTGVSYADAPSRLGLVPVSTATANGWQWGAPRGSHPLYPNVSLAILQIGTNDINAENTDGSTNKVDAFLENCALFVRTARAAGADPILVAPPHEVDITPYGHRYIGRYKSRLAALAVSLGCVYVDFSEALGPVNTWAGKGYSTALPSNPHLNKTAYQAEADFLWDNVLSL